ncbi:hypothetical protein, partial [Oceanimonas smirnovii]|uniref:hypothetical protein n=1 Tax=Oceanimonas smirnovii TaxID=264574 RepID=UPI003FD60A9C
MKFRELNCWELSDDIQGLVYFAQRLDEMLFDYSLDTYKPPALCAPYLCKEAISLIQDIEDSLIDKANLKHVLEELQWAIGNDPVAKSLLDSDLNQYFTVEDNAKLIDRKLKLEVLWRTFNPERYLIACQEQLKEAIKVKSKKTIEVLSRLYISTLINENLSKNVIAEKVEEFFFQGVKGNISSLEQLDEFFKYLFPYFHNFEMVFIADKLINKVKESAKAFKIEIIEELPEGFKEYAIEQDFALQENEVFVLTKKFKAKDVYTAREKAERKLDNLSDLFMVFAHKSKVSWKDKALVRQCCKEGFSIVGKPISSMEKGMDLRPNVASKRLNTMIKNFSVNKESFERFSRVVDLHGVSIVNDIPENQLLNMWIGLETITPTHIGN